jgi:hypothetical protein
MNQNMTALLALLGVVIGALLSYLFTWRLRREESKLQLTEKILDRQIEAHEEIGRLAESLYGVYQIGYYRDDIEGNAELPWFLYSVQNYKEFKTKLLQEWNQYRFWLAPDVHEEFALLFVYLFEMEKILVQANPDNFSAVGLILVNDFANFSTRIGNCCRRYLARRVFTLRPDAGYTALSNSALKDRRKALANTILFSRRNDVETIAKSDPSDLRRRERFTRVVAEDA